MSKIYGWVENAEGSTVQATISLTLEQYDKLCKETNTHIMLIDAKIEPNDMRTILAAMFIKDANLQLPGGE